MYNDKRTDAETFDQIRQKHVTKDEGRMAAEIRATLEARKGGLLTKVKTDAPLTLTGQWDQRGGTRVAFLGVLASAAFVVLMLTGCGSRELPAAPEPPHPTLRRSDRIIEFYFPNGTYCVQSRIGGLPMACDFSHRDDKVDNLEF